MDYFLLIVGIIGTIAFSISGALTAIEKKLDLFGVIILACVTACGGGLLRDLMIGNDFAMFSDWWYPLIAVLVAIVAFVVMWFLKDLEWENSNAYKITYMVIDAMGLGAFVVVGALRAQNYGKVDCYEVIWYSVLTAVGGGMLRDILVCRIPAIFRKHIYAVAAIIGAFFYYLLYILNVNNWVIAISTISLVMIIRYFAFHFKWSLPRIHLKTEE